MSDTTIAVVSILADLQPVVGAVIAAAIAAGVAGAFAPPQSWFSRVPAGWFGRAA